MSIPTERLHAEIDELFAREGDLGKVLEEMTGVPVRLLQTSLCWAVLDRASKGCSTGPETPPLTAAFSEFTVGP